MCLKGVCYIRFLLYVYAGVCGCVSISEIVYLLYDIYGYGVLFNASEDMLHVVWADRSTKCANILAIAHFPLLLCICTVIVVTIFC